jgi:hypothetical protein
MKPKSINLRRSQSIGVGFPGNPDGITLLVLTNHSLSDVLVVSETLYYYQQTGILERGLFGSTSKFESSTKFHA